MVSAASTVIVSQFSRIDACRLRVALTHLRKPSSSSAPRLESRSSLGMCGTFLLASHLSAIMWPSSGNHAAISSNHVTSLATCQTLNHPCIISRSSACQIAIRWQSGSKQVPTRRQSDGDQTTIRWRSDSDQMVINWQPDHLSSSANDGSS